MANKEQLAILRQGSDVWNKWRVLHDGDEDTPTVLRQDIDLSRADLREGAFDLRGAILSRADLRGAVLDGVNLSSVNLFRANLSSATLVAANLDSAYLMETNLNEANLSQAILKGAFLTNATLRGASLREAVFFREKATNILDATKRTSSDLTGSDLTGADLTKADLRGALVHECTLDAAKLCKANLQGLDLSGVSLCNADLREANLRKTNLSGANLSGVNLGGADLTSSILMRTNVSNATISNSNVFGVNVWDLEGEFKEQTDLIITPEMESAIRVDNIEIAQFVYLILNNKKLRNVINTLTSKTVLILGRFAIPERKIILDALRNQLRNHDLLPIVFDFDRPTDKDFTETIKTLASISYFVIADITNPKSSPLELQATVPDYQIPFVPIIQAGESSFAMMVDLQKKYPWVLPTRSYDSIDTLMATLKPGIIDPAVEMRNKLRLIKAQEQATENLRDYLDKSL
jgi:uncharacterized protein YjbI with pentapeptide repeats